MDNHEADIPAIVSIAGVCLVAALVVVAFVPACVLAVVARRCRQTEASHE